jgi:hypothetical protein
MVAPAHALTTRISSLPGFSAEWAAVGLTFLVLLVLLPLLLVGAAARLTRRLAPTEGSTTEVATRYAWSLVPAGFGMWLAHYLLHFVVAASGAVAALMVRTPWVDTLPAAWPRGPLLPGGWLLPLQLVALEAGALASVWIAHRIARRDVGPGANRAFLPWAALAVALSFLGMWLLTQPMQMRGMAGG